MLEDALPLGDSLFYSLGPNGSTLLSGLDPLPEVPALNGTRLQLELLLQESSVNLREVSEVILSDAGATLQLFRLVGREYPDEDSRPTRIEDCLVSLSIDSWYHGLCSSTASQTGQVQAGWQHYRRVAQCARDLAHCVDGVSPEEAYIVGLLHELGKFPHLLGWNGSGVTAGEHRALGVMLADYWHLPSFLLSAIQGEQEPAISTHWGEILQMARELAC